MTDKTTPAGSRDIIVCALDSTLADHAGAPNRTLIQLLSDLVEAYSCRQLVIVSDKVEPLRQDVLVWLNTHVDYYHDVIMRPAASASSSPADLMRSRILTAGAPNVRMPLPSQVLCAFDARPEVRVVWGQHGVPCHLVPKEGW